MSDEFKVGSFVTVLGCIAFSIMCLSIKGCNDSDNAVKSRAIEHGCTVLPSSGSPNILCKGEK